MAILIGYVLLLLSIVIMTISIDKKLDKIMDHFNIEEKEEKK